MGVGSWSDEVVSWVGRVQAQRLAAAAMEGEGGATPEATSGHTPVGTPPAPGPAAAALPPRAVSAGPGRGRLGGGGVLPVSSRPSPFTAPGGRTSEGNDPASLAAGTSAHAPSPVVINPLMAAKQAAVTVSSAAALDGHLGLGPGPTQLPPPAAVPASAQVVYGVPADHPMLAVRWSWDRALAPAVTVWVTGPFGAPSVQLHHYRHFVLVAGGIGVTAIAPVHYCLAKALPLVRSGDGGAATARRNEGVAHASSVTTVWTTRDRALLEAFSPLLGAEDNGDGSGSSAEEESGRGGVSGHAAAPATSPASAPASAPGKLRLLSSQRARSAGGGGGGAASNPLAVGQKLAATKSWTSSFSVFADVAVKKRHEAAPDSRVRLRVYLTSGRKKGQAPVSVARLAAAVAAADAEASASGPAGRSVVGNPLHAAAHSPPAATTSTAATTAPMARSHLRVGVGASGGAAVADLVPRAPPASVSRPALRALNTADIAATVGGAAPLPAPSSSPTASLAAAAARPASVSIRRSPTAGGPQVPPSPSGGGVTAPNAFAPVHSRPTRLARKPPPPPIPEDGVAAAPTPPEGGLRASMRNLAALLTGATSPRGVAAGAAFAGPAPPVPVPLPPSKAGSGGTSAHAKAGSPAGGAAGSPTAAARPVSLTRAVAGSVRLMLGLGGGPDGSPRAPAPGAPIADLAVAVGPAPRPSSLGSGGGSWRDLGVRGSVRMLAGLSAIAPPAHIVGTAGETVNVGADDLDDATREALEAVNDGAAALPVPVVNRERPDIPRTLADIGRELAAAHPPVPAPGRHTPAASWWVALAAALWAVLCCRGCRRRGGGGGSGGALTSSPPTAGNAFHRGKRQFSRHSSERDSAGRLAVAVVVCGPPELVAATAAAVASLNAGGGGGGGVVWHLHRETFLF
jgi:hypothetical protein